jgi:ATP-dependent protease ClpP protease subunit
MKYIKPEVHTLCIGNAFGESAMLLSAGTPVRMSTRDT